MHELPLVKSIFESVMEYAEKNSAVSVTDVYLQVGVLRDFVPEFILKYWKYLSKDTICQDSHFYIEEIPATAKCSRCNRVYIINPEKIEESKCPDCGYDSGFIITGREVILDRIEIRTGEQHE